MKKLGLALTVFLFSVFAFASVASAAQNITETPDVKIVIDGDKGTYTDVTIIADGRTLLPLREVLTKLGVPNDNDHIIWDAQKRSVTVKKDDKVIYLEVGNTVGSVNGKELTIDVPPIIYPKNNRTYIPARFVAESLGKEVLWDASTRSVLIADKENYNQVKDILTKSNEAMKSVNKYKFDMDLDVYVAQNQFEMKYGVNMDAEVDQKDKAVHMLTTIDMFGIEMESESYLKDGYTYTKEVETGEWKKEALNESQYEELFKSNSDMSSINEKDFGLLSAGMIVVKSDNADEIVVKGDVISSDFMNGFASGLAATGSTITEVSYDDFSMELVFDKNTYVMKGMAMSFDGKVAQESGGGNFGMKLKIDISDFNGDFEIVVPQEAQ